jgi:ribosome maturation factor RimP
VLGAWTGSNNEVGTKWVSGIWAVGKRAVGIREMIEIQDKIARLIEAPLQDMGYELVRVSLSSGDHPILQIMAERADDGSMGVGDCTAVSHTVSLLLDAEDPITSAYSLEVSSPGIDRPLTRPKDFERYAGFEVRMETRELVSGRRRFKGRLLGIANDNVSVSTEAGEAVVPFDAIAKAQLVLTDELIAAASPARQKA